MDEELIQRLLENDKSYNFLKAIEELNELATVLTQWLSKGATDEKIIEEIGDVKMRVKVIERYFDKKLIKQRIDHKSEKYKKYIKEKTFKNI